MSAGKDPFVKRSMSELGLTRLLSLVWGSVCRYGGGPCSGSAHTSCMPRSACALQMARHQPKWLAFSALNSGASGSVTCG